MSALLRNLNTITLFVDDLARTKEFYANVFGASLIFEDPNSAVFDLGNVMINLLNETEADELIAPAPVASRDAGSRMQFTINVPDVDATAAELAARGVQLLNGPIDRPWGVRTICFADPAGHVWEVAT